MAQLTGVRQRSSTRTNHFAPVKYCSWPEMQKRTSRDPLDALPGALVGKPAVIARASNIRAAWRQNEAATKSYELQHSMQKSVMNICDLQILLAKLDRHLRQYWQPPLPLPQFSVMAALCDKEQMTPGALASIEGVTPGMVSQTLDALDKKGLVIRKRGVNNRTAIVTLSPLGVDTIAAARFEYEQGLTSVLDVLSQDERRILHCAIKVIDALSL